MGLRLEGAEEREREEEDNESKKQKLQKYKTRQMKGARIVENNKDVSSTVTEIREVLTSKFLRVSVISSMLSNKTSTNLRKIVVGLRGKKVRAVPKSYIAMIQNDAELTDFDPLSGESGNWLEVAGRYHKVYQATITRRI